MQKKTVGKRQADQNRLDVTQVAKRLNVSRQTVYRLIHIREFKGAAFGSVRGYQVWESSIEEYEHKKCRRRKLDCSSGVLHSHACNLGLQSRSTLLSCTWRQ